MIAAELHDYSTRKQTPEQEAQLITHLAAGRAADAERHPAACTCVPCQVRRQDENEQRLLAATARTAGAR